MWPDPLAHEGAVMRRREACSQHTVSARMQTRACSESAGLHRHAALRSPIAWIASFAAPGGLNAAQKGRM